MENKLSNLNKILEKIPVSASSIENFLVKGIKLEHSDSYNPLVKLLLNYYLKKENIAVFTSPLEEKAEAIGEICAHLKNIYLSECSTYFNEESKVSTSSLYAIITTEKFTKYLVSKRCDNIFTISNIKASSFHYPFLIFYNTDVPVEFLKTSPQSTHISIFSDYQGLYIPSNYSKYVSEKLSYIPSTFTYTTICKYPNKKNVNFLFGTNNDIKHISIPVGSESYCSSIVYYNTELNTRVRKYFYDNQLRLVSNFNRYIEFLEIESCKQLDENMPILSDNITGIDIFKSNSLIFYDIDLELIPKALDCLDNITIVYTRDNYSIMADISRLLKEKGVDVPDFIDKLK